MNNFKKKILLIGTRCDYKRNRFTGQSMMFEGIINVTKMHYKTSIIDISSHFGNTNLLRTLDYSFILLKMFVLCALHQYDLVYIVTSQSKRGFYRDYCFVNICRIFKIKVIAHQYGANYHQMIDALHYKNMLRLHKMIDYISKIIVEGNYMKNQYSFYSGYNEKIAVIPNGLPIEGKNIMQPKHYNADKPFRLFYLSNMIYSKGYFDVLKAIDILVNHEKCNVTCIFAGQFLKSADDPNEIGDIKKKFINYINSHNLNRNVEYYSGLYGIDKDNVFLESNVFLLPTYYINEGQPVSIIEAMAYGCVPIVTKYRHIPMMINDYNGCFVEPQSPESIVNAVKHLMTEPDIYHNKSKMAINDYKHNFKFEVYASNVRKEMEMTMNKL